MKTNIKDTLLVAAVLLGSFALGGCSNEETLPPTGDDIRFNATLIPSATIATRAGTDAPLTSTVGEVTIIAPGYANEEATWQQSTYTVGTNGALTPTDTKNAIKRTALNMPFAAWTTPTGVDATEKTVDFAADLENFIGTWIQAKTESASSVVTLPFQHLVSKLTLTVVKSDGTSSSTIGSAGISFPAIKKTGYFTATLSELPKVTNGTSGEVLKKALSVTNDKGSGSIYLPPLSNFAENGTFTLTVDGVDYIGTLHNLKDNTTKDPITELKAGQHLIVTIKILDDHSIQFLAATIAPWKENDGEELFNRPGPGIWSGEDLVEFAKAYNEGKSSTDDFKKKYVVEENGKLYIRLYSDIRVKAGFEAIGTTTTPFTGFTFDGNGYTISNISAKQKAKDDQGLFGYTKDVRLQNIRLNSCLIEGKENVGILVGRAGAKTIIDNCRIEGNSSASGTNNIGGLVGSLEADAQLTNCCISGGSSIAGEKYVGGIAGINAGNIANAYAILSGLDGTHAGGLVGTLTDTAKLRNCYASSNFTNGTGVSTNGALIGTVATGAVATSLYWDANSISNDKCPSAIGGKDASENLSEIITGGCSAFSAISGRLISSATGKDDNQAYLFDRLNEYIPSLVEGSYKGWAIIGTSRLPVLRP